MVHVYDAVAWKFGVLPPLQLSLQAWLITGAGMLHACTFALNTTLVGPPVFAMIRFSRQFRLQSLLADLHQGEEGQGEAHD